MKLKPIRTDSNHADFMKLIQSLDTYLAQIDGDEHGFYKQFNKIDHLKNVVIIYDNGQALGCGAIKAFEEKKMEVKRMYTLPESRGKGIASAVLSELEKWAKELGCDRCILETGQRMPDAIGLYQKTGYKKIDNYGQYIGVENSRCFEKKL
ncbi:MAG: GNAT superfamily N-acetyltransferase [Roseivirga sp.]|jgi:putative acetyltransferase